SAGTLIIGDMPVVSVNLIAGLNDMMDKLFKDGNTATEVAYDLRDIVVYISIISWIKWFTQIWTVREYVLANEVFISSQDSVVPCGKGIFPDLTKLNKYFIKFVSETNEAVFNSVKEIKSECGICIQGVMAAIIESVSQSVFSHPMDVMELERILGKRWLEILTMSMWPSITKEEIEKH
ncbi:23173_t:CDS:2, partial [Gigaspora margarita]